MRVVIIKIKNIKIPCRRCTRRNGTYLYAQKMLTFDGKYEWTKVLHGHPLLKFYKKLSGTKFGVTPVHTSRPSNMAPNISCSASMDP